MFLTRSALRNPVAVLMLSVVLIVLAGFAILRVPIDTLPKLTIPALQIITPYNGADPHTVEQSVTYPMEKAISAVSGISYIQSVSKEGISIVKAYFDWGTNLDRAEVEAIQQANGTLSQLPPGVSNPFVLKFDISNFPVCALAIQSRTLDERKLYDVAFNEIEPFLEHVDGVSTAPVNGGKIRQINVYLDRDKLAGYGLTMQDVYAAVGNANFLFPSGDIKVGHTDYRVLTDTQFPTVDPMNNLVISSHNGAPVHIKDVGQVVDGAALQTQVVRINGQHGIMMFITKQPGQNTVQVVDGIKKALGRLSGRMHAHYPDMEFHIFFDQSIPIRDSINSLVHETLSGALLAALVILVFLRSVRSTVFVSLSMPLSALAAIFMLYLTGQTFNVFTLGGLTLAMGRLVDDAIVVIENISRHLNEGDDRLTSVIKGTEEVGMPVLASTITTVIVFLPILFLEGFPKFLFGPLAITVTFALFASYLASLTIIPVLSRRWLLPEQTDIHKEGPWWDRMSARLHHAYDGMSHIYARVLRVVMRVKVLVTVVVVSLFVLSLGTLPKIGKELLPAQDENMFIVLGRAPIGTRLEETEKYVADCEKVLRDTLGSDITVLGSDAGIPSTQRGTNAAAAAFSQNPGPHGFTIRVNLKPAAERANSVYDDMNRVRPLLVGRYPGVQIFLAPAGITNFLLNLGAQGAIDVQISGYDLDTSFRLAGQVADIIHNTPGAADAQIKLQNDYPEVHVKLDREKASLLGINTHSIADSVLTALNGNTSSNTVWTDPLTGNQYNLVTQFLPQYQQKFSDVSEIPFRAADGSRVNLHDFAQVKLATGPLEIDRQNQVRVLDVTANAVNRPLGDVAGDLLNRIKHDVKLPDGFSIDVIGQFAQQQQSFGQMPAALALSMLLVYAIMATQFRSLVDPFIIIFTVPLGFIGVLWMLLVTHTSLSVESFMGIITMIGIVVSNGILLVDFANQLRREGRTAEEAVIEAGRVRLRPILMTAIATIVGLIPMGFSHGAGSEAHAPLARAVVGGLSVSTFLTLFFVPILYSWLEKRDTQVGDDI